MICRFAVVFLIISLAFAEIYQNEPDKERLVGVDTVHHVKIDKDAVFTQHGVHPKKNQAKKAHDKDSSSSSIASKENGNQDREPDWSYKQFPKEVNQHVLQFKRNMTECLKEVQARDRRPIKRLSPKTESPVHGECLIACVLKRNAVIHDGKINKDNLIKLVSKFYAKDTKLMKKLEKNIDRCILSSLNIKKRGDECALASHLNSCTNDLMNPKHQITLEYK